MSNEREKSMLQLFTEVICKFDQDFQVPRKCVTAVRMLRDEFDKRFVEEHGESDE